MFLRKNAPHAIGIDIADRLVRAVELHRGGITSRSAVHLHAWNEVPLPEGAVLNGVIADEAALVSALKELRATARPHRFSTNGVVAALPDERCFIKTLEVAPVAGVAFDETVRAAASGELPIPLESASFDWAPLGARRVVAAAAPKELVESWVHAFEAAGFAPYAFEVESSAIARSLGFPARASEWPLAAVDIGATRTGFMLYDHGAINLTVTIPVSGNAFTDQIASGLSLPREKAEELKISCGLDPARCETKLRGLVENMLDELVSGIRMAIRYYKSQAGHAGEKLHSIYLVGGGSHIAKIDAVLSQKLYLKVRHGDPLAGMKLHHAHRFPRDQAECFATAIGAALRGIDSIDRLIGGHEILWSR